MPETFKCHHAAKTKILLHGASNKFSCPALVSQKVRSCVLNIESILSRASLNGGMIRTTAIINSMRSTKSPIALNTAADGRNFACSAARYVQRAGRSHVVSLAAPATRPRCRPYLTLSPPMRNTSGSGSARGDPRRVRTHRGRRQTLCVCRSRFADSRLGRRTGSSALERRNDQRVSVKAGEQAPLGEQLERSLGRR